MSLPNPFLTINSKVPEMPQNSIEHVRQNNQNYHKNPRWTPQKNQRGGFNNHRGNFRDPAVGRNFQQNNQQPGTSSLFSCLYCKESFPNQMELQIHRRSHQKCPYDECSFNANEATIAEHVQKVHMKTAKIKDLTTPEDIEKWREERRKRFPTTANVQLRQQIQEMKQNRGEKLQDSKARFGDNKQKNFVDDKKVHKKDKRKQNEQLKKAKKNAQNLVDKVFPLPQENEKEKVSLKFTGTKGMDYNQDQSSLSLLGGYGTDSDPEEEDLNKTNESLESNEEEATGNEISELQEPSNEHDNEEPDAESPMELSNPKEDVQPLLPSTSTKRKLPQTRVNHPKKPKSAIDYSKLRNIKSTNPFLEKLLHREIVHERNYLLQCVSYVVKNNFFGVGQEETKNDHENA